MLLYRLYDPLYRQEILLHQAGAVHLPTALYQIMRLVHQKGHIPLFLDGEETS